MSPPGRWPGRRAPCPSLPGGLAALALAVALMAGAVQGGPPAAGGDPLARLAIRAGQGVHGLLTRVHLARWAPPPGYAVARGPCAEAWAPADRAQAAREVARAVRPGLEAIARAVGLPEERVDAACRRRGPVVVVLYPRPGELAAAFGLPPEEAPEGAYRRGVVGLLLPPGGVGPVCPGAGPTACTALVHELAHWLVDAYTGGHVPVWLDEGLAQLAELRVTGRAGPAAVSGPPDSLADLERRFRRLDPARAYAEALWLTEAVERRAGPGALDRWLDGLAAGLPVERALVRGTGLQRADLAALLAELRRGGDASAAAAVPGRWPGETRSPGPDGQRAGRGTAPHAAN